jgi:hypothetical protein
VVWVRRLATTLPVSGSDFDLKRSASRVRKDSIVAVSIAFYSVVARNSTITERFPGGMDGDADARPNASFCTDGNVARVGFMAFDDANAHVEWLRSFGFVISPETSDSEIAIVREDKGHLLPCNWLQLGSVDGRPIAWLSGTEPGLAVIPRAEFERASTTSPLSPEELRQRYDLVSRDDRGLETYQDKATGERIYIGRVTARERPRRWWRKTWRRLTPG